MEFTAEELVKNWETFLSIIKNEIPSRADELIKMYDTFEDRVQCTLLQVEWSTITMPSQVDT